MYKLLAALGTRLQLLYNSDIQAVIYNTNIYPDNTAHFLFFIPL